MPSAKSAPTFTAQSETNGLNTGAMFKLIDKDGKGFVSLEELLAALSNRGILVDDPRLQKFIAEVKKTPTTSVEGFHITPEAFDDFIRQHAIAKNAFSKNLVIPDFEDFTKDIKDIFDQTAKNEGGKVADYIPQLARVNPDQFAVSVCTTDGQRYSTGDFNTRFCLQSSSKPFTYCLTLEEHGEDIVHQHIGREPSGQSFNELTLNKNGLPHNPLINSGAIMAVSLVKRHLEIADRFDHISRVYDRLCAGNRVSFNNAVYLSERQTADRNFALAYFMRENNAFPEKTNIVETLELYFQCCSIESCTHDLSIAAATLANAGVNPVTGERIYSAKTVQNCLSLMLSCGMYNFSGEFAFKIGIPAKSGVSGVLLVVVPNLMGFAIWSPRLDQFGNSVRGVEFCEHLVERYNIHNYDSLSSNTSKKNPRRSKNETKIDQLVSLIWAASNGDLDEVKRLDSEGFDLSTPDYDGRTALHLAASEGQTETVAYLIECEVNLEPIDRWGGTPLSDAKKSKHTETAKIIEAALAKRKTANSTPPKEA